MQLLTPLALALTALTGLVLVFHALRPRYTQQEVPSLRLWQTVTEALSLQARWRRIVRSLLLLVHLLIVLLLALAAAQPILTWRGESALHVHIVDASASMLATDVSPNRFDVAIRQAAASMGDQSGRWAVILAGSSPRLLYHGPSRQEAVNALLAAEPETGGADWAAAADLLATFGEDPSTIVLWTDGSDAPEALAPLLARDGLTVRVVGGDVPFNVGITAFDARRRGEDPLQYEALVAVRNFSERDASGTVRVAADESPLFTAEFALGPGQEQAYTFPVRLEGFAALTARLDVTDHFDLDNAVQMEVRGLETTRVALVGPRNRHLEDVLRVFPQVDFDVRLFVGPDDPYHLRVYDRLPHDDRPGTQLVFAPPSAGPWAEAPVIVWWDPVHPLTRYVEWSSVRVLRARPLPVGGATRVLVESTAGPLVTVADRDDGALIQVGFSLDDSDFAQRVAFPVFMDAVLQLAHEAGRQPVSPAPLPPAGEASLARRIDPVNPADAGAPPEAVSVARALWPPLAVTVIALLFLEGWLFRNRGGNPLKLRRREGAFRPGRGKGGVPD